MLQTHYPLSRSQTCIVCKQSPSDAYIALIQFLYCHIWRKMTSIKSLSELRRLSMRTQLEQKHRNGSSFVPRPLPDFISQPWRKFGRRPGIKTTSRTRNGGLGQYVTWTRFVLTESTISWSGLGTRLLPFLCFSPVLQCFPLVLIIFQSAISNKISN